MLLHVMCVCECLCYIYIHTYYNYAVSVLSIAFCSHFNCSAVATSRRRSRMAQGKGRRAGSGEQSTCLRLVLTLCPSSPRAAHLNNNKKRSRANSTNGVSSQINLHSLIPACFCCCVSAILFCHTYTHTRILQLLLLLLLDSISCNMQESRQTCEYNNQSSVSLPRDLTHHQI